MKQPLCRRAGQERSGSAISTPTTRGGIKNKKQAQAELEENIAVLDDLGYRLYAENRRSLLLVLQGMDTAGKDGTIRHVMQGFNPQSCQVTSFKQPGVDELAHDFLWRIGRAVPRKGFIGIFNRSHYEDVLVVRVHNLVPKEEWESRYERINLFEKMLHRGRHRRSSRSFCTSARRSNAGGCNRGWTIRRSAGSSAGPTSRSDAIGTTTSGRTKRR